MAEHSYFLYPTGKLQFLAVQPVQIFWGYGCFLKWWYPQNTPKRSFFVGKPMVVEYHHFRKPPYGSWFIVHPHKMQLQLSQILGLPRRQLRLSRTPLFVDNTNMVRNSKKTIPKKTVLHPNIKSTSFLYCSNHPEMVQNKSITLQGTNIQS